MSTTSQPPPQRAHHFAQSLPLSPPSPTSSSSATTHSTIHIPKKTLVQTQTNLPSSPAPSHSSVDVTPNIDTLNISGPTPPASVPMSAQQSQTSVNDAAPYSPPATSNPSADVSQKMQPKGVYENQLRAVSGSKRKMEDESLETPSKRARTEEPESTGESPSIPSAEDGSEFGPLFRLCSQPLSLSKPHATQNLIRLYELDDIAQSVARKDANGEKINKLRRSYENYIKDIAGKDKIRKEDMELRSLSMYPDDEYYVHKVQGKELANGMSDSMLAKLTKATGMGAGKLPDKEDRKWKNNLDVGAPTTVAQPPLVSTQKRPSDASPQYPATSPTTSEPGRPSRRGTKRRYNDESFEGYGEGFADDTHDTRSLDNDDVDASLAGKRKRRRDTAGSPKYPDFGPNGISNAVSVGGYSGR